MPRKPKRYRSKYLNEETAPYRIRSMSKEQLQEAVSGCRYVRDVLRKLDMPLQAYLGKQILAACEKHGISTEQFPIKRRQDLTGQKFGHLTALRIGPTLKCGNTTWICREEETGIEKPVLTKHLLKGNTKSFSFGFKRGPNHVQWTGYQLISGSYWSCTRNHALTRKLAFDVTVEDAWALYVRQGRRCALSGVPIYFGERACDPQTASLDRIDSSKGYTLDNVQWVHSRINIMKNKFSQEEFIAFCRAVAATHPEGLGENGSVAA